MNLSNMRELNHTRLYVYVYMCISKLFQTITLVIWFEAVWTYKTLKRQ